MAWGVFLGFAAAAAEAVVEVGLVTWSFDPMEERTIEGLVERLGDLQGSAVLLRRDSVLSDDRFLAHMEEFRRRKVACVVVVGNLAARKAHEGRWWRHFPIVAAAIDDPRSLGLERQSADGPEMTGVVDALPLRESFDLLRYLSPAASSVGFLFEKRSSGAALAEVFDLDRIGAALNLSIRPVAVDDRLTMGEDFLRHVEGLDAVLVGRGRGPMEQALSLLLRDEERPVYALSEEGVASGAVAGLFVDRRRLGRETARLVSSILKGAKASAVPYVFCREARLAVNLAGARRAGIGVPPLMMAEAAGVWRSASGRAWYGEDGLLLPSLRIENDPEGKIYRPIGVVSAATRSCRPFLEGLVRALRQSRNNYDLFMVAAEGDSDDRASLLARVEAKADLLVSVGSVTTGAVLSLPSKVPVVFAGTLDVAGEALVSRVPSVTGSSDLLPAKEQVRFLRSLFGADALFVLPRPSSPTGNEADRLRDGMIGDGLEAALLDLKASLSPEATARSLADAVADARSRGRRPVLVVPALPAVYRALPALASIMKAEDLAFPVYVTSPWIQHRWGGTVAPDVAPEDVGLAAGRYVVRILEQGISPGDLPLWTQQGTRSVRLMRRWRELSRWSLPPSWGGGVKELLVEEVVP
ncbi:hypothetical protein KAR29_02510 [Aminithiophilus ramosus]|uniref:Uncharacterized protein n=2 Tax=Synergistales TaxID=649776 RepID=A0A9Q7AQ61_9BACT|nr:ABC transporter substrate binding protein [Aminithiophilus ramosus]QTX32822.1 hypothetical protein KAR29_02510 [Aminithiophilus ramosus]QVL36697.1 hypothetical protein KIH16_02500 [Synergistota bacterium]